MTLPLPRTGPSRRCRLQFTTKTRLSSCSREASEIAPSVSGSSHSPSPRNAHTRLALVSSMLAVLEVPVEAGVVERGDRPEAHRHGGELPEVGHQARVRIRRQARVRPADLTTEVVEVVLGQAALEERTGVHAGRGVALEVDVIAGGAVVLAAEEVVEADLVQRRRAGEGRQVPADAVGGLVRPHDHHRRVPADERPDAALDVLVAREPRLLLARDGVDVRRRHRGRERHLALGGALHQTAEEVAGTGLAVRVDDSVEAVEPLARSPSDRCRAAGGRGRRRS